MPKARSCVSVKLRVWTLHWACLLASFWRTRWRTVNKCIASIHADIWQHTINGLLCHMTTHRHTQFKSCNIQTEAAQSFLLVKNTTLTKGLPNGIFYTSSLKSDVTTVFLDPNFLQESRRRNFGDSAINKGYIAFFHCAFIICFMIYAIAMGEIIKLISTISSFYKDVLIVAEIYLELYDNVTWVHCTDDPWHTLAQTANMSNILLIAFVVLWTCRVPSNACGNICRNIMLRQSATRRSGAHDNAGMWPTTHTQCPD